MIYIQSVTLSVEHRVGDHACGGCGRAALGRLPEAPVSHGLSGRLRRILLLGFLTGLLLLGGSRLNWLLHAEEVVRVR